MDRRSFVRAASGSMAIASLGAGAAAAENGPGYASPAAAAKAPPEKLLYTTALYVGSDPSRPDYLATVDVDPKSSGYGSVIHRLPMPKAGDELHHFGWNICSSCHQDIGRDRRYLVVPGLRSSRIHIVDTKDLRSPRMHKVIEPEEVIAKTDLTAPHTVHCLADGTIMISMLGNGKGEGPGGFLLLDQDFNIKGRWERKATGMRYNYDFWYQPRKNVMVSSEWASPTTFQPGFKLDDVANGRYGQHIHFWDWKRRVITQSVDLGKEGLIPLEVRFLHDPESEQGFVGAALSSTMWRWYRESGEWKAQKVIAVDPVPTKGWDFPVPGLITDLVVSMDDRFLYFSNWLHGDIRQYDIRDPSQPKLTGQVWLGGVIGHPPDKTLPPGGPQMLQLSLDGRRLYVTSSLFSSWDNQFFPGMAKAGSFLCKIDCNPSGGLSIDKDFLVDFGKEPGGPARAHEMRYPGGDCTSDIWT